MQLALTTGGPPVREGRRVNDAYYTPKALADFLVELVGHHMGPRSTVVEPSAGGGTFVRALRAQGHHVTAVDVESMCWSVQPGNADDAFVGDFLSWVPETRPAWVVGNPPFSEAEAHVRHALGLARRGVAFLLRLAFLEGGERVDFWRDFPASWVYVLSQRVSFTGGGTDNTAYALFVWDWLDHPARREWLARMRVVSWR